LLGIVLELITDASLTLHGFTLWVQWCHSLHISSISSFLHPYDSHLPFTPVLTTRIIRPFHFLELLLSHLYRGNAVAVLSASVEPA